MELTEGQKQGLATALERYKYGEPYTVICGYAGTGKSTLVKFIIEALGIDENDVVYTAFTGKATQVLQRKGNKNCKTLHKLLFKHYMQDDGTYVRSRVPYLEEKLVVVDECSMAPKELVEILLSHHVYTLFLGDNSQLPPVSPDQDNHLLDHPHIMLTEIMRQEAESEIIQLSMKIRQCQPLTEFHGKEVQVIHKSDLTTGMMTWADQILVAKNETRNTVNKKMRQLLGHTGELPERGDKVICLHNYWNKVAENDNVLINGTIGYLDRVIPAKVFIPPKFGGGTFSIIKANFTSDCGDDFGKLPMDKRLILEGEKTLSNEMTFKLMKNKKTKDKVPLEFTYGYAITCHKSQGSEWDNVLVLEENFPFDTIEHSRWLYTAVTRAAKKLVIVMKD